MTKIIQAKFKISRRYGVNLWGSSKDPVAKRNYIPGQHGPSMSKRSNSNYAIQLSAKQKLKGYYGRISERQFVLMFKEALRMRGNTGDNLVGLLERRLDAFVYRMNFASTIFGARQMVSHGHITVNGKKVDIPSYHLKPGDVVEIKEKSRQRIDVIENTKQMARAIPEYISYSTDTPFKGIFSRIPTLLEIPYPIKMEPNLVVEYYSA